MIRWPFKAAAFAVLGIFLFSCVPPRPRPRIAAPPSDQETMDVVPSDLKRDGRPYNALIYVVHPNGDAHKLIGFLSKQFDRRMTLVFPPRYFDAPGNKETLGRFRVLQSSRQIEVGLTIENEPNLALLSDLNSAFPTRSQNWGFNFNWPDDAAEQIARASGAYQKRWGLLPGGLIPPYLAINAPSIKAMARFRLSWTMGRPQASPQIYYVGSTAVLLPPTPPAISAPEGSPEWARFLSTWTISQPFAVINGAGWTDPNSELVFLEAWDRAGRSAASDFQRPLAEEVINQLDEAFRVASPDKSSASQKELSEWVQSSFQRSAWQALAEARAALESYKNSGRAVLSRLDAATSEMMTAESGPFLLSLGTTSNPEPSNTHLFIATLANVYRLTGTPIPSDLNRLFLQKKWSKTSMPQSGPTKPFFEYRDKLLVWNDPALDDFGGGTFRPPLGNFTAGTFDLSQFRVSWTDGDVVFSFSTVGGIPNVKMSPLLPLLDIYLDVNRLTSAGSVEPLPQRGGESVDRDAAWEYAIVMSPLSTSLYQPLPGREPRRVDTFESSLSGDKQTVSVRIPRNLVRGNPAEWRFTVTLSVHEQSTSPVEILKPLPITANPTNRSIGGGLHGRNGPRILDLLAPTVDDQKTAVQPFSQGGKVVLPYVESL